MYVRWWRSTNQVSWTLAKDWSYMGDGIGTGDPGSGCATGLPDGFWYQAEFVPFSSTNNNFIVTYNTNNVIPTLVSPMAFLDAASDTIIAPRIDSSSDWDAINTHMAANHTIGVKNGGISGKVFIMQNISSGGSAGSGDSSDYYTITINTNSSNNHHKAKFLISHEIGHGVYWFATNRKFAGVQDNSQQVTSVPECDHPAGTASGSPMNGKEYQSGAFHEAFAHFYSAAIWNRRTDGDCTFHHYKDYYEDFFYVGYPADPVLDCRDGDTYWPQPYMDTYCAGQPGEGVAIDWLRALWFLYENTDSSFNVGGILDWISSADIWASQLGTPTTVTSLTDAAYGEDFYTTWLFAVWGNGLNP